MVFYTGGQWKNARYVSNLISGIFIRYEWIMDLLNALILTILSFFIEKLVKINHNILTPIVLNIMLFSVSSGIVRYVYGYASVLYLFPVFFLLAYLCLLFELLDKNKLSKCQYALFFVLAYLNACFLEHIAFAFTGLLCILVFYTKIKTHKWNIPILICCAMSAIETCRLFLYILRTETRGVKDKLWAGELPNRNMVL